jgi:hypothetical protein
MVNYVIIGNKHTDIIGGLVINKNLLTTTTTIGAING